VFSDVDGDVAFCIAAGRPVEPGDRFGAIAIGTIAAQVTAAAIRDAALMHSSTRDPGTGRT
jgi:L-aminopeptidase/D-esterase-like protein